MQKYFYLKNSIILAIIFVSLVACTPQQTTVISPTQPIYLESYQTITPLPSQAPSSIEVQPTIPPLPTATPFQYTIQSGDTLLGIAYRFGITLDELYLANPNISPNALSIGQALNIPNASTNQNTTITLSSEILPLDTTPPICYPSSSAGLWCFTKITNNTEHFAENISLTLYIYNRSGNIIADQLITPPSNLLPSNTSTVASYYFKNIESYQSANATLTTAVQAQNHSQRYITSVFDQTELIISPDKSAATIKGTLQLQAIPQSYSWVIAIAYDQNNNPVGIRHWESTQQDQQLPVELTVYSTGGAINSLEILIEAR